MRIRILVSLLAVGSIILLGACGGSSNNSEPGKDTSGLLDTIGEDGGLPDSVPNQDTLPGQDTGGADADQDLVPGTDTEPGQDTIPGQDTTDVVAPECNPACGACQECVDGACENLCSQGQVCSNGNCVEPSGDHELEEPNESGVNDSFEDAQPIPLNQDFSGHIGTLGDQDWFSFAVEEEGVVTFTLEFEDAFAAEAIYYMLVAAYTDVWLQSNTAAGASDPTAFTCDDHLSTMIACQDSITIKMSVTPVVGTYVFYVEGYGYEGFYPGWDSQNPYHLRVDFAPGDTLESDQPVVDGIEVGEADSWRTAKEIAFGEDGYGTLAVQSYGFYWYDIDWYRLVTKAPGWLRLTADVLAAEDDNPSPMDFQIILDGSVALMTEAGPVDITDGALDFSVGDYPNCQLRRREIYGVPANGDFYLRLASMPGTDLGPYKIKLEYQPGMPEDLQPVIDGEEVGAAEDYTKAFHLGELVPGDTREISSYNWHLHDWDWYSFDIPAGAGGDLDVVLDISDSFDALGEYSCPGNPDGIEIWTYLFEEGDYDWPGIAYSAENGVPSQNIQSPVDGGKTYYVIVLSRANLDQENPYTLSVTFTE